MRCDHSFSHGASHATQEPSVFSVALRPHISPSMTMGSGSSSVLLGRATFSDPADPVFKVKRITGDWQMEIKSKPAFDIAIQTITFQPGGKSGCHSHHSTWQLSFGYVLHVVCRICIYQQISRVDSRFRRPCGYNHTDSLLARFDAMHGAVKLDTTGCYTP